MMRHSLVRLALTLPLLAVPVAARAQAPTAAAAFRAEYLRQLDDTEKKLVSLCTSPART